MFRPTRFNPQIGSAAESEALAHLQEHGLRLIVRNFRRKTGEIDLIMHDQQEVVFVEVKARKQLAHGHPAEYVTAAKQRKIIRTAMLYLQKHPKLAEQPCRFDVLALLTANPTTFHWIPNAFQ